MSAKPKPASDPKPASEPTPSRQRFIGIAMVVLAACMWGTWPLLLRYVDRDGSMPASIQTTILMATMAVVCFAIVPFDRVRVKATRREWLGLVWLGVGDALNAMCLFYAYKIANVAIAVLTHDLGPLLVAIAAPLLLKERVRARTFLAIALALLGLSLMLRPWRVSATHDEVMGAAFGLLSAVFYASNVLVNKRLTRAFSGSELMAWHGLFGLPVLLFFSGWDAWTHVRASSVILMAVSAIGPGAMGGLLFCWAVRRVNASLAATVALLEPMVAIMLSIVVLGERMTALAAAGAVLVLLGAWVTARARS